MADRVQALDGWREELYWRMRHVDAHRTGGLIVRVQRHEATLTGEWVGMAEGGRYLIIRDELDVRDGTEQWIRLTAKKTLIDGLPAREWTALP